MLNRKSSHYSGKTKNSSLGSYMSMQSIYSKDSLTNPHSLISYNSPYPDQSLFDLQKELKEKDSTIFLLQERIDELLASPEKTKAQSPEYLHKLIKKGDQKLHELKKQIDLITKENEDLVSKQKELVAVVVRVKKENIDLKQMLSSRKGENFVGVEERLEEIERMHEKLIRENSELKAEVKELSSKKTEMSDLRFSVLASEIYKAKVEITQILKVFRIIKSGKELDLGLLLQHKREEETFNNDSYKQCGSLVVCIRKDVEEIKELISDVSAEYYGSHCVTQ